MFELGFHPIAIEPIAMIALDQLGGDPFLDLLSSKDGAGFFLVELRAKRFDVLPISQINSWAIAEYPIGMEHLDDEGAIDFEETRLITDVRFNGRPQDLYFSNRGAERRLVSALNRSRSIPRSISDTRRVQVTFGGIAVSNADGGFDDWAANYSFKRRFQRIFYGPLWAPLVDSTGKQVDVRQYDAHNMRLIAEVYGEDAVGDYDSIEIKIAQIENLLDVGIHQSIYAGTGGADGDVNLAGRYKPVCLGECNYVPALLINAGALVYQVHEAAIAGVDEVSVAGLPLNYAGDYPTYSALVLAALNPGEYATCLALGIFRLATDPGAAPVLANVRGDSALGYVNTTADILLRAALIRARLSSSQIDQLSYSILPIGRVGRYYDGAQQVNVATLYDELLRPCNAFYAQGTDRSIRIGVHPTLETTNENYVITAGDMLASPRVSETDLESFKSVTMYWGRSFAAGVVSPDQLSDLLSAEQKLAITQIGSKVKVSSQQTAVFDEGSIDAGPYETFFLDEPDVRTVASDVLLQRRANVKTYFITIGRKGLTWLEGQIVRVIDDRLGLGGNGRKFEIIGIKDKQSAGEIAVELELLG